MEQFNEENAKKELEKGYKKAEKILENKEKMERFLQKLEQKLKLIPVAGDTLSMVPILVSLIRSYVKKEYKDIPIGTIVAIVSALLYWLSPVDVIPDVFPGVGYVDDAMVIATCLKLVKSDVDEYQKWRNENNKIIVD